MDHEGFARLCLDPVRLAALGRAAEGSVRADALARTMGIRRREALQAIADLRLAHLVDDDGHLIDDELHSIAATLRGPEPASPAIVVGEWSDAEVKILQSFFSGERLTTIPSHRAKRSVVLERLAQDFEPGVRYDERAVSAQLRSYNDDYAALRRYLVDEGLMTRSDGVYWRSGGRVPPGPAPDAAMRTEEPASVIAREPTLRTRNPAITLAPFTMTHRSGLLEAADDERIARHMTDQFRSPYTGADADAWISKCMAEDPPINFVILVSGIVAGGVGSEPHGDISTGTAELGWWLAPGWWGRGIAATALERLIEYCFEDLDLHRVEAGVFLDNPASARVAEKAGFILEGIARDGYLKDGRLVDRLYYGLARSSLGDTGGTG
jgi:RimJ/RimL family protein N-acetyltransferase